MTQEAGESLKLNREQYIKDRESEIRRIQREITTAALANIANKVLAVHPEITYIRLDVTGDSTLGYFPFVREVLDANENVLAKYPANTELSRSIESVIGDDITYNTAAGIQAESFWDAAGNDRVYPIYNLVTLSKMEFDINR